VPKSTKKQLPPARIERKDFLGELLLGLFDVKKFKFLTFLNADISKSKTYREKRQRTKLIEKLCRSR
jgi:hypothetical protein